MKLYGGIDLHSNNSVIHLVNEDGDSQFKKRVTNDTAVIVTLLDPYLDSLVGLVVESTYNWYWLVDGLMEAGFKVHLACDPQPVCTGINNNRCVLVKPSRSHQSGVYM